MFEWSFLSATATVPYVEDPVRPETAVRDDPGSHDAWVARVGGEGVLGEMKFSNTITIDRPVRDVFAFVANLENVPRWNHAIVETRKRSDGPAGVGTTYRQIRSLPRRSEGSLEVTELEADRRFAVHGQLGPFAGTLTYAFEEIAGATRLTNTADLDVHGVLRLATPLVSGRARDAVAANLEALKTLLEDAHRSDRGGSPTSGRGS